MSTERNEFGNAAIGRDIDGYRIEAVLGRGGMGIVYRAEDEALSRTVALKMIDPSLVRDEGFLRRFRAEARALARIDSPHIVGIYALRQTEIGHFIVMEFVDGGTVSDLMEKGPIPWKRCVPIIQQILKALHDAHGVGVIHRDIKPGNVMLSDGGRVKVADFGLAKMNERDGESTVTMGISGTLYYMSPEQVKGLRDLDHRSDLYSLGILCYEMLTGKLPVERGASQFTVMKEIVEKKFVPPNAIVRNLPEELNAIVMKALEKNPADRFQSAAEMLDALSRLAGDDAPEAAIPVERHTGTGERRSRLAVAVAAAGVILLAAAGYFVWNLTRTVSPQPPRATISIYSEPDAALVSINGVPIGETPLASVTHSAGPAAISLSRPGYASLDTSVTFREGDNPSLSFVLVPRDEVAVGRLAVRSTPAGATILLNGEPLGTTPLDGSEVAAGVHALEVRRDGYQTIRRHRVEVREGELVSVAFDLQPVAETERPPPRETGLLTVSAEPQGRIRVDGESVSAGQTLSLASGRSYEITCGDAPYEAVQRVTIAPNETTAVSCYFQHTVNVVVQEIEGDEVHPSWATLLINGETAPAMSNLLGPGTHDIRVRREFYRGILADTTLVVRPSFNPVTHRISFQITRE